VTIIDGLYCFNCGAEFDEIADFMRLLGTLEPEKQNAKRFNRLAGQASQNYTPW